MPDAFGLLLTALLGGVGAAARFALDTGVTARIVRMGRTPRLPWGTLAVNLLGSLGIGVVVGIGSVALPATWATVIGVGLFGGFTTFSTASYETVRLLQRGRWGAALLVGIGQLLTAVLAVALGWWIGASLGSLVR